MTLREQVIAKLGDFCGAFWVTTRGRLQRLSEIFGLLYRLLQTAVTGPAGLRLMRREFQRQLYLIGWRGFPLITLSGLFLGLGLIVYSSTQLAKIQAEEYLGNLLVVFVIREFGPVLTALLVLLRSGAATIVEVGGMILDRELEALELMGVEPEIIIGGPRFWGLILSLGSLFLFFVAAALLGGFFTAQLFTDLYWERFWVSLLNALSWPDIFLSLTKILLFGMLTGVATIYYGFWVRDTWESVVRQTSRGLVTSLLLISASNALLTMVYYL